MADPSGLDDLEAELRRMEEELSALQGKKAPKKKAPKPAEPEAPAGDAPRKPRFGMKLPALGKKKAPEAPPEALAAYVDAVTGKAAAPTPEAPVVAPAVAPQRPGGRWRQDGRAWVLTLPAKEPVVLRRVLDADGNLVREEPAGPELLAPAPPSAAPEEEPQPEKPLHALAERLAGRKKKGGLFRKKGD